MQEWYICKKCHNIVDYKIETLLDMIRGHQMIFYVDSMHEDCQAKEEEENPSK